MGKVEIQTRFENGSISFRMADDRLVKLTKGTISSLMGLIRERGPVRSGALDIWVRYWRGSVELVRGPNGEMLSEWDSQPRWKHQPYISLSELCEILGLLTGRDLTAYRDFTAGVDFRTCKAYIDWNLSNQESDFYNPDRHSKIATTVVDQEAWERMTQGDG
jgi:hypothetical protein